MVRVAGTCSSHFDTWVCCSGFADILLFILLGLWVGTLAYSGHGIWEGNHDTVSLLLLPLRRGVVLRFA